MLEFLVGYPDSSVLSNRNFALNNHEVDVFEIVGSSMFSRHTLLSMLLPKIRPSLRFGIPERLQPFFDLCNVGKLLAAPTNELDGIAKLFNGILKPNPITVDHFRQWLDFKWSRTKAAEYAVTRGSMSGSFWRVVFVLVVS